MVPQGNFRPVHLRRGFKLALNQSKGRPRPEGQSAKNINFETNFSRKMFSN